MVKTFINSLLIFNIILIVSFSISVNTLTEISLINVFFYIFFHLTFIYFIFYQYHYAHLFLAFIYGVLFDIFLLNAIGSHLICFLILIATYVLFKKYLFLLSSYQVSIVIFITLNTTLYGEIFLAYLLNNIHYSFQDLSKYFIISIIIFIPSIFFLNKIDR